MATKRLVRISCTIPETVLQLTDAAAKRERRSRSWIISEALREYADRGRGRSQVREPPAPYQAAPPSPGLGSYRQGQLEADLALTPEQRVIIADETAALGRPRGPAARRIIQFDRYEDYLAWKRTEAIGG